MLLTNGIWCKWILVKRGPLYKGYHSAWEGCTVLLFTWTFLLYISNNYHCSSHQCRTILLVSYQNSYFWILVVFFLDTFLFCWSHLIMMSPLSDWRQEYMRIAETFLKQLYSIVVQKNNKTKLLCMISEWQWLIFYYSLLTCNLFSVTP